MMDTKAQDPVGSNLAATQENIPMPVEKSGDMADAVSPSVFGTGATAFTTYYTWRANGVFRAVRFTAPAVNPNSRVFVNISEYGGDPQSRFIGLARMAVYNIAPGNGEFYAWVEISWDYPLNIRFDVLIDP